MFYQQIRNKLKKKFYKLILKSKHGIKYQYFRNERLINLDYRVSTSKKKIQLSKTFYQNCLKLVFRGEQDDIRKGSQWKPIYNQIHHKILELIKKDKSLIKDVVDNPCNYNLFYGFDTNCKIFKDNPRFIDKYENTTLLADKILSFSEYLGLLKFNNPERLEVNLPILNVDTLINKIEQKIKIKLKFVNPFPGEEGILTKKGILTDRELQAIYQAYKIKMLSKNKNHKILEIGGGLGRTAYYCYRFGLKNYTLVDLKFPLLSQFSYLSKTLTENKVSFKNKNSKNSIKLFTPNELFRSKKKYDLVFNSDSFTEIDEKNQKKYLDYIKRYCKHFYSINHEANPNSVNDLSLSKNFKNLSRNIYWLRKGYLEEFFEIR